MHLAAILRDSDENRRVWLVGDPARSYREHTPAANEQRTVTRNQGLKSGVGWLNKKAEDYGNAHVEVRLSTTMLFDSIADAWRWRNALSALAEADQPFPWHGDVILRLLLGDGSWEEAKMPAANVQLEPLLTGGLSQPVTYLFTAPYIISNYRTGRTVALTATAASPATAAEGFFSWPAAAGDGWVLNLQRTDSGGMTEELFFEINTSGSLINPGYIELPDTFEACYALIASEAVDAGWDAELVTGPTPGVRFRSAITGASTFAAWFVLDTSASPRGSGNANGTDATTTPGCALVDAAGAVLIADSIV